MAFGDQRNRIPVVHSFIACGVSLAGVGTASPVHVYVDIHQL